MGEALQYLRMVATGAFRHGATAYAGTLKNSFSRKNTYEYFRNQSLAA
jgi:hypothetical protein